MRFCRKATSALILVVTVIAAALFLLLPSERTPFRYGKQGNRSQTTGPCADGLSWEMVLLAAENHSSSEKERLERFVESCRLRDEALLGRFLLRHWDAWDRLSPLPTPLIPSEAPSCWEDCRRNPELSAELDAVRPFTVIVAVRVGRDGRPNAAMVPRRFRQWSYPEKYASCVADCFSSYRFVPAFVGGRFVSSTAYFATRWDYELAE